MNENEVFTSIATALRAEYDPISVYGEYVASPAVFPSVSVVQIINTTNTQDMSGKTTHENITYQIDVYSNLSSGKKSQAKAIAKAVDRIMQGTYRMARILAEPVPNEYDTTIYRITLRYRRVAGIADTI